MQPDHPIPHDFNPSSYHILVVDDEPTILPMMKQILGRAGYQVEIAPDAYSGLDILSGQHFDLLILDNMMPGMDGYEMLTHIRADSRWDDVPVLIYGGNTDIEGLHLAVKRGADSILTKPASAIELTNKVRDMIIRGRKRGVN